MILVHQARAVMLARASVPHTVLSVTVRLAGPVIHATMVGSYPIKMHRITNIFT